MYQRMKIQLVRFFLFHGSSVVLSNEERSLLTVFVPIDVLPASDDVFHYVTSQLALRRRGGQHAEEASFDAGGFAYFFFFFLTLDPETDTAKNVPLMAVWTADLPLLCCEHVAHTDVAL
ncbi:hypothetical protein TcCL_ESM12415 [Trypanosoma cruzi]|nr:hypothetical protein TcCL_ESM12415 [Trypanosoma cruzi]